MANALEASALTVLRGERAILRDVSLAAEYGSLLAIVGPNGAGKSTLLKAMAGLIDHAGSVRIDGTERSALSFQMRARAVGYVPQRSLLAAGISVADVIAQARFAHRRGFSLSRKRDGVVERVLARTDLCKLRDRTYDSLSGGEQRRVLVARALASEAKLLLLDEPTAGLDVAHVLHFFGLLSSLRAEGYALVCVLHDLTDVRRHADQTLLLESGRLVRAGATCEVLQTDQVRSVYGVHTHENAALGFSLNGSWQ